MRRGTVNLLYYQSGESSRPATILTPPSGATSGFYLWVTRTLAKLNAES
jgi:hypothetical protein